MGKAKKRTYKKGRVYYCAKCMYYSWRDGDTGTIKRDMWHLFPSVKAISRTCNECAAK